MPAPTFPNTPGSVIRATATDDSRPSLYMLAVLDVDPDGVPAWIHPHRPDEPYRQQDLTLLEVVHDEGRAQMLANLPTWGDLTDADKGAALGFLWKFANEDSDYARENYPARFLDHPVLTQLDDDEACQYAEGLGFSLDWADGIHGSEGDLVFSWDEFERLTTAADVAARARREAQKG